MKIYIQNNGVYGAIVVVANNIEEAIELIKENSMFLTSDKSFTHNLEKNPIEEKEISVGLVVANFGDS